MKRLTQVLLATIVLGAPALVFLLAADDMRKKAGEKTFIAKVLLPASYMLLIMSTFVYLFGIQEVFGEKEYRDVWVFEALLYLIPGAYFLVKSDAVNRKEGAAKSSLTYPLYVIGGLCIAATLVSFVFGFNDFLYADKQDMTWLAKTAAYVVPAAICLYLAEKLK
jgi:ABC-type multidrug transport system permease subunit